MHAIRKVPCQLSYEEFRRECARYNRLLKLAGLIASDFYKTCNHLRFWKLTSSERHEKFDEFMNRNLNPKMKERVETGDAEQRDQPKEIQRYCKHERVRARVTKKYRKGSNISWFTMSATCMLCGKSRNHDRAKNLKGCNIFFQQNVYFIDDQMTVSSNERASIPFNVMLRHEYDRYI